ncbi:MAG TPA: hypothetical protein VLB46_13805 [Pyrinomonadaceae bacterium]|nr:hypothetical protein [Pyrinomonadaceae bacterium]
MNTRRDYQRCGFAGDDWQNTWYCQVKLAATRIMSCLRNELPPSANGLVIFACAGADVYFQTVQLDAPIQQMKSLYGSMMSNAVRSLL